MAGPALGLTRDYFETGQLCFSAHSNPSRLMSIARIRRCPSSLYPHPQRYIIQRNDGLIQVIRSILKGGETKVPLASAASAIPSEYAW